VARLVVLRGDTPDREIDLIRLPVRIGRGPQNDLVLEDHVKSVSRDHAEIRFEDGRYLLVDLESQNGIWVGGNRVPYVALEPNVVASIGPFRLRVEGDAAPGTSPLPAAGASDAGTQHVHPAGVSPPAKPRPDRISGPGRKFTLELTRQQKSAIGGVAALAAVAAIAAAVVLLWPSRTTDGTLQEIAQRVTAAKQQIEQGACAAAIAENIEPALARNPDNADLLNLKRQAEACIAALPPSERTPAEAAEAAIAADLTAARDLIGRGDCSTALNTHISNVLNTNPDNAEALDLKTQAEACSKAAESKPRPPTSPPAQLAQSLPPEDGGLETLPGELDRDYQARVRAMRSRYDEAILASSKGPSRRAIALWEAMVRDATPKYLDVSAKLAEARRAWRATAQPLLSEARDLVAKGMWNEAIQKLNEAHDVDPALPIDAEIRNAEAQKLAAGQQECRLGRQTISYNHAVGMQHFRRALTLLPPDDPCYPDAKRWVSEPGK